MIGQEVDWVTAQHAPCNLLYPSYIQQTQTPTAILHTPALQQHEDNRMKQGAGLHIGAAGGSARQRRPAVLITLQLEHPASLLVEYCPARPG